MLLLKNTYYYIEKYLLIYIGKIILLYIPVILLLLKALKQYYTKKVDFIVFSIIEYPLFNASFLGSKIRF